MPDLYSDDFAVKKWEIYKRLDVFIGFPRMTIEIQKKVVNSSPLKKEIIAITRLQ